MIYRPCPPCPWPLGSRDVVEGDGSSFTTPGLHPVGPGLEDDKFRRPQDADSKVHLEQGGGGGKRLRINGEEDPYSLHRARSDGIDCGFVQSIGGPLAIRSDPSSTSPNKWML